MARTKKADKEKTIPTQETPEQTEGTAPVPETPEQVEDTTPAPEVPVKTSQEEAAAIEAQIETAGVGKLDMGESEETEPEPDMFANLPNPCVYCGPSVKGVARQYTTYQGGIPDSMRKFIQEHPGVLGLIVSTGTFPDMRRRLEKHGTKEAELYKAVKAEL